MHLFFKIAAVVLVLLPCAGLHAGEMGRIVSLKPNITDIVYALGLGGRLVGVTRYCEVPEGSPAPEIVGDYTQPYLEKIIALSPDIVLGSRENSSRRSVEPIMKSGIRIEFYPFTTLDDTLNSMRAIGNAVGLSERGNELANRMQREIAGLKNRFERSPIKRVIVVWGLRPIVIAGRGTYMDELLSVVGAVNAATKSKIKYPRIGIEELIVLDPDMIIDLSMGSEATKSNGAQKPWDGIDAIRAVRNKTVITMNAGEFRAGPGLPAALAKLAEMIHAGQ